MENKTKNDEVIFECYRRLFKEAEPSADFDELHKKGITKKREFFMDYYLEGERMEEIIIEVGKEFKFKGHKLQQLKTTIYLGCSPTACKEWKERKKPMKD